MSKTVVPLVMILLILMAGYLTLNHQNQPRTESHHVGNILTDVPTIDVVNNTESVSETKPANVYFTGDVMLARDVEQRILKLGNKSPFDNIDFDEGSYVVINFESAIPSVHVPTPNNTFRFSTPKDFLPLLVDLGVTHLSLSNNHAYDFSLSGYNHTISSIWESGMTPFGHPSQISTTSVVYLDIKGGRVGLVAIHTLFSTPDKSQLSAILNEVRENSDWQIAYIHWGEEYVKSANESQMSLAKTLVGNGVDLIVGHHPHVVQGLTRVDNVLVIPSLGNFIFDQYFSEEVEEGLVVKLSVEDDLMVELLPVSSKEARIQPRYMLGDEKTQFLSRLASSSDESLRADIIRGELTI